MVLKRLLPVLVVCACAACRNDMQDQPKHLPLQRSWFYADGRSARPFPPGAIATDEPQGDPGLTTGSADGTFLAAIPMPVTADLLGRGEQRYNIYCSPCHGLTGNGDGMIARRGFKYPANLNSEGVRNAPPGYIYAVITNGFGAMASYSYQIRSVRDRWAIVAYIRALELSRNATLDDVPADERVQLEARR
jgi:mono/diheme cytochrome c family protein